MEKFKEVLRNKKSKKARSYKVQDNFGVPTLTIKGKFLTKDFGIEPGSQLQLVEGKNMLVLMKVPSIEIEYQNDVERLRVCEQEVEYLREKLDLEVV